MPSFSTPGVYRQEILLQPVGPMPTAVPALIGFVTASEASQAGLAKVPLGAAWQVVTPQEAANSAAGPLPIRQWPQYAQRFGAAANVGYLAQAVYGFFQNGGVTCYPVAVCVDSPDTSTSALMDALEALAPLDGVDLVCVPDIMRWPDSDRIHMQQRLLLDHCTAVGDRFAILDAAPRLDYTAIPVRAGSLRSANGALYYPWLYVATNGLPSQIPPSGHIAGIYARSDQQVGVHKAPANELIKGALDLEFDLTDRQQGPLNEAGVNCLRSFPGRGIRVWGARTLSDDTAWTYVNVRRLFLTAGRWIARTLADVSFEPNDPLLWSRIEREINGYCNGLLKGGALRGASAEEAFFVRCDISTNPPEVRDSGEVVTEIGLAPSRPNEFIVARIVHGPSGVTLTGPAQAA